MADEPEEPYIPAPFEALVAAYREYTRHQRNMVPYYGQGKHYIVSVFAAKHHVPVRQLQQFIDDIALGELEASAQRGEHGGEQDA